MGLLNGSDASGRAARARMEQAERESRQKLEAERTDAQGKPLPSRPRRYKLYDRISDRVSVTTMNVIIGATVLLLIIALVYGIATGNQY